MSSGRAVTAVSILAVGGFSGWLLMKGVSPSREDIIKKLPEGDAETFQQSQNETQRLMDALKAAADNPQPIYRSMMKKE